MKKIYIIMLILLVVLSAFAIAGAVKIPVYNPFGRHLQYISTGIDGALTKDILWTATGTTTTLNTTFNNTANLTVFGDTIYLVDNLTLLNFPSSGVLIIGTEAITYYNYTVGSNLTADNVTTVTIEKRAAYGTTNASHTAADSVYFTRFLIGTDNSTAPWYAVNSNGQTGMGTIVPGVELEVNGNITGNLNWTNLQSYPAACPTGSAVTTVGDSITCTEFALLDSASNAGNLNLTGYNITSNRLTTTDLVATNLEADIDATGYSITASTELASTTVDATNLEADNLESNMDGTGYNVTVDCIVFASGGTICTS